MTAWLWSGAFGARILALADRLAAHSESADGLGQVTLARTTRPKKQCVFTLADEGAGGKVEHQTAIHLRIEVEVEVVERLLRIAEGGLFAPPLQQAVAAPRQLVGDQA